jgi:hypothetical protein
MATTGCEKFLDVNQNVNNPLTATPESILAQALKVTGDNFANNYTSYGNWVVGYWAKSGTVNGFPEERTYNYTSLYQQALWNNTYDNLYDYDLVEKGSVAQGRTNLAAIAKIMKVYNFQLLVDQYGDIPYTQALQGLSNVVPKYDKAEDIYKDLVAKLNEATATIAAIPASERAVGTEDIMFGGTMANWTRFANTLKLRLLLRQSGFAADGTGASQYEIAKLNGATFLTTDAQVQPGFIQSEGQQNPFYNRYGVVASGLASATERNYVQPTNFIISQYKLNKGDSRLVRLYTAATDPSVAGQYVGVVLGESNTKLLAFYSRIRLNGGLLKGFDAPVPLILAAESNFLQAEAKTRGLLTGGDAAAQTNYDAGITASFAYYYREAPSRVGGAGDSSAFVTLPIYTPTASEIATLTPAQLATRIRLASGKVARYRAANVGNPKVDWAANPSANSKVEKIIYQKYLAMNGVESIEAWNEYRRTGIPRTSTTDATGVTQFASQESFATRPDKLPVRLLYPQTEIATNLGNIPTGINQYTSKIFWDVVD